MVWGSRAASDFIPIRRAWREAVSTALHAVGGVFRLGIDRANFMDSSASLHPMLSAPAKRGRLPWPTAATRCRSAVRSMLVAVWAVAAFQPHSDAQTSRPIQVALESEAVDFSTHVLPLLHKTGCNNLSCHGAFQGQSGFRLSLFANQLNKDWDSLRERIDAVDPAKSRLLQKVRGDLDHGGGEPLPEGSAEYRLLEKWVLAGAERGGAAASWKLTTDPDELIVDASSQLNVRILASDGERRLDVTGLCRLRTRDAEVATVEAGGQITAHQRGRATQLTAEYGHTVAHFDLYVPLEHSVEDAVQAVGQPADDSDLDTIDSILSWRLRVLGVTPSERCEDGKFLRRITIDLAGRLPTLEELDTFEADSDPNKRAAAVDRLLSSREFSQKWGSWLARLTGCRPERTFLIRTAAGHLKIAPEHFVAWWCLWFADRIEEDWSCAEMINHVLLASSRDGDGFDQYSNWINQVTQDSTQSADLYRKKTTNDLFLRVYGQVMIRDVLPAFVGEAFLGSSLACAKCHDHPFEPWTQEEYKHLQSAFQFVRYDVAPRHSFAERQTIAKRVMWLTSGLAGFVLCGAWFLRRRRWHKTVLVIGSLTVIAMMIAGYVFHSFWYLIARQDPSSYQTAGANLAQAISSSISNEHHLIAIYAFTGLVLLTFVVALVAALRWLHASRTRFILCMSLLAAMTFSLCMAADAYFALGPGQDEGINLCIWLRRQYSDPDAYTGRSYWEVFEDDTTRSPADIMALKTASDGELSISDVRGRDDLMRWMAAGEQPPLARNLTNRIWTELMGRQLLREGSGGSDHHPASHPQLMNSLVSDFIGHEWSLKHLVRTIVLSDAYQRQSELGPGASSREVEYASFAKRPLIGPALVTALEQVTGIEYEYPNPDPNLHSPFLLSGYRPPKQTNVCRSMRMLYPTSDSTSGIGLDGTLFLLVDPSIQTRLTELQIPTTQEFPNRLNDLYRLGLSRTATQEEQALIEGFISSKSDRVEIWPDVVWTLINLEEFLTVE